jgi:hypothetical protein
MPLLEAIPYIIALMILWDFSLHVYDLLHVFDKTKSKHPLGAYLIYDYFSKGDQEKRKKVRQAFILLLLYLTLK